MTLDLGNVEAPEPTLRMLGALDLISDTLNINIPERCYNDFFLCSMFLDMYLDKAKAIVYFEEYPQPENINDAAYADLFAHMFCLN